MNEYVQPVKKAIIKPHMAKYCPHCDDFFYNLEDVSCIREVGVCNLCLEELKETEQKK